MTKEEFIELATLTGEDEECLKEIKGVLERFGKSNRFGVTLLHEHFDVDDDEVMQETTIPTKRRLVQTPVSRKLIDESEFAATSWELSGDTPRPLTVCPFHPVYGHIFGVV